jgi:proline dehydrogenase
VPEGVDAARAPEDENPSVAPNLNAALRRAILAAADSRRIRRLVARHGLRLGARRFVAGETLDDAVRVLRRLNDQGLRANTTLLGEGVATDAEAAAVVDRYEEVIRRLSDEQLQANVALKLTHLGLVFDEELAYANVERLVAFAAGIGQFVRIDMEESVRVDPTLRIYRRLREAGHDNVGTVLQSYLYRTPEDLVSLLPLRPNLRLVKGAYLEPPDIAYPDKADVDRAYAALLERMLGECAFTAVATHDERLIGRAIELAEARGLGPDRFELQMLYGVRPQLQADLARRGYRVLVATPYGPDWYPYLMRRLAERPANLLFFLRHLLRR